MGSSTSNAGPYPSLVELLRFRADQQSDKAAYVFLDSAGKEEAQLTYLDLDRRARSFAARLQRVVADGDRTILLYPSAIDFVVAFFGCLYAGVVAVPAYPPRLNRPLTRFLATLSDSKASLILTTAPIARGIEKRFPESPELASVQWAVIDTEEEDRAASWRDPQVGADTLAFLQYTSGSTAAPRGVMVTHGNVLHNESVIQQGSGHNESSVFVTWLPLFHDMGLIGLTLQSLHVGGVCVVLSPLAFLQRPSSWLRAISKYRGTTSGSPNFGYDLCVNKISIEERSGLDLSSWTLAFSGAEPIRHSTLKQFVEAYAPYGLGKSVLCPVYGLAEATLLVSGGWADIERGPIESGGRSLMSCGSNRVPVRIVDPASCTLVADGEVGEIWVSGPSVAQGYWNQPELTERTFRARIAGSDEGPFLRTGDLGFFQDGELVVAGRLRDLIIIRGRNVYPQDIEQTVEACHPAVRPASVGVLGIETEEVEGLLVVSEVDSRQCPDLDDAVGAIRQAIAEEHDVPVDGIVLLKPAAFPRTSSGKLQRWACRERLLSGSLPGVLLWRGHSMVSATAADDVA